MDYLKSKIHGVVDYVYGIFLIVSPWTLGFATGGPEEWAPIMVGLAIIVLSILTNYEAGTVKLIPFSIHLWIDALSGAFLVLSPWILDFKEAIMWPHILLGILLIGLVLITERDSRYITIEKQ